MRSADFLQLQSVAGNRAARNAAQRQMEVGAAGDAHELEADAVAREIMSSSGAVETQRAAEEEDEMQLKRVQREADNDLDDNAEGEAEDEELQLKRIQREAEGGESEDEELQLKRVQRYEGEEDIEEEAMADRKFAQREAMPEVGMAGGAASADTSSAVDGARGGGQPLGEGVRNEMESHFGADFSAVRVHQDSQAADLNDRLSARAFTTGSDIFVGREGLNTGSRGGKELLAHELTHVVQQGAAGRKPRRQTR